MNIALECRIADQYAARFRSYTLLDNVGYLARPPLTGNLPYRIDGGILDHVNDDGPMPCKRRRGSPSIGLRRQTTLSSVPP